MQRFAIKIDKSVKARLKNLCRLCGIDNPNQIEILNAAEWIDLTIDGEVSLSRKIADCVGIEVGLTFYYDNSLCPFFFFFFSSTIHERVDVNFNSL